MVCPFPAKGGHAPPTDENQIRDRYLVMATIATVHSGPPPFDDWHPPDPECDGGVSLARAQTERAEMIVPGLMREMERRLEMSSDFAKIGKEIGELVATKNAAYGDSFAKAGDFLRLLYPAGIMPSQYDDALALVRIFDKQMRIATRKEAFGESPYRDIAGYGVLGAAKDEKSGTDEAIERR